MVAPDPTPATGAREGRGARYQEIAGILARHGLGYAVGVLGLERFVPFHRGWLGHPRRRVPYTRPEHLRMVLEDLGTTFIKLGQILSTRADLLPPEYQSELAKLQDAAPPVPWEVIAHELEQQLGRPPEESFAAIDPVPLAAASIGQAHAAVLAGGTEVVVKVRRPGVVPQVERDLGILEDLAATASRRWELADRYDVVGIVQEFGATLRAEMDYVREGHSAERFAAAFAGDPNVHIPRIFWEFSTGTILTLERIRGAKITDTDALAASGALPSEAEAVSTHQDPPACALTHCPLLRSGRALKHFSNWGFYEGINISGEAKCTSGQIRELWGAMSACLCGMAIPYQRKPLLRSFRKLFKKHSLKQQQISI